MRKRDLKATMQERAEEYILVCTADFSEDRQWVRDRSPLRAV